MIDRALKGRRCSLAGSFLSEWNDTYSAGQCGTIQWTEGETVVVCLDGYEEGKAHDEKLRRDCGEGFNVVPWIIEIPLSLLKLETVIG